MIRSMTGFGKAVEEVPGKKILVSIKSLNSKYADISLKLPVLYKDKEMDIRNQLAASLQRGKIELFAQVENMNGSEAGVINQSLVVSYYKQLKEIATQLNISDDPELLQSALRMPDVMKSEIKEAGQKEYKQLEAVINVALEQIEEFRKQEGKALSADLKKRVSLIGNKLDGIKAMEKERVEIIKNRLDKNIHEFLDKEKVDENRLEQEIVFYLEKLDITEEIVRLRNHLGYFMNTIEDKEEAAGKKLGFIAQEIGREINTIGSKANHAGIQKIVVEMKDELEKIKEQLMNVL